MIKKRTRKNGEVSWLIRYLGAKDPVTGERKRLYATVRGTLRDARREETRLRRDVDTGAHVRPDAITLRDWCEHWLANVAPLRGIAGRTRQRYEELIRGYVLRTLGAVRLQELAAGQVQKLYVNLLQCGGRDGRPLARRTVHHVHRVLSEILESARKEQYIVRNPCGLVAAPRPDASPAKAFNESELAQILEAIEGRELAPLVRLALVTGARRGELAGLRWSDIDFNHGIARIERSVEKVRKVLAIKLPKTRTSYRDVRLYKDDLEWLREHWRRQAEVSLAFGVRLPPDAYLFPASPERPCEVIDPDRITQIFATLLSRLNLKKRGLSFHSLRHTSVSMLLRARADLKAVSARIGHSQPTVTLKTYQHVLDGMEEQTAKLASEILSKKGSQNG